jgi:hypothetical protein
LPRTFDPPTGPQYAILMQPDGTITEVSSEGDLFDRDEICAALGAKHLNTVGLEVTCPARKLYLRAFVDDAGRGKKLPLNTPASDLCNKDLYGPVVFIERPSTTRKRHAGEPFGIAHLMMRLRWLEEVSRRMAAAISRSVAIDSEGCHRYARSELYDAWVNLGLRDEAIHGGLIVCETKKKPSSSTQTEAPTT